MKLKKKKIYVFNYEWFVVLQPELSAKSMFAFPFFFSPRYCWIKMTSNISVVFEHRHWKFAHCFFHHSLIHIHPFLPPKKISTHVQSLITSCMLQGTWQPKATAVDLSAFLSAQRTHVKAVFAQACIYDISIFAPTTYGIKPRNKKNFFSFQVQFVEENLWRHCYYVFIINEHVTK